MGEGGGGGWGIIKNLIFFNSICNSGEARKIKRRWMNKISNKKKTEKD